MKKLITILILSSLPIVAQENVNLSINTDYAIIKEGKLNIGAELELDMKYFYFKGGFETFQLGINYTDLHGGLGTSIRFFDDRLRTYAGVRLGVIWREEKAQVPLFGFELGTQYKLGEVISVGAYGVYDVRQDGMFLYGTPEYWRFSGKIKLVIELGILN